MADKGLLTGELQQRYYRYKQMLEENNFSMPTKKIMFGVRMTVMTSLIIFSIANAVTGMAVQKTETECIWDGFFVATQPLNNYFAENEGIKHIMMILSSALIDSILFIFTVRYILWGKSWRPLIWFMSFYLTRTLIQSVFIMKFPEDNLWDYPGVPSITVTYLRTTDFFYSGHVGVMVFCALENRHEGNRVLMYLSTFAAFFEFFVLLVLRAHYAVDMFAGIVFAHYFWIISGWISPYIDRWGGYKDCRDDYNKLQL